MAKGELNHRSFHLAYLVLASGYIDATTLYSYKSSHNDLVQCEKIQCHSSSHFLEKRNNDIVKFLLQEESIASF
jgi:hypothetical protein